MYEYPKQEIGERIKEIFQVLDMETFADNHIGKLSTGQTQRASIARCLMADPQLYILDEPTLGLDILSADAIIYFMQQQKEKGKNCAVFNSLSGGSRSAVRPYLYDL